MTTNIEAIIPAGPYNEYGVCECYVAQTQGQCLHPDIEESAARLLEFLSTPGPHLVPFPAAGDGALIDDETGEVHYEDDQRVEDERTYNDLIAAGLSRHMR